MISKMISQTNRTTFLLLSAIILKNMENVGKKKDTIQQELVAFKSRKLKRKSEVSQYHYFVIVVGTRVKYTHWLQRKSVLKITARLGHQT